MRRLVGFACAAALCLGSAGPAGAASSMGFTAPRGGAVVQVEGGCGPYGFRDYYGYCRPRRVYAPPVVRRFYGCPYGFRPTPFGCRPFY